MSKKHYIGIFMNLWYFWAFPNILYKYFQSRGAHLPYPEVLTESWGICIANVDSPGGPKGCILGGWPSPENPCYLIVWPYAVKMSSPFVWAEFVFIFHMQLFHLYLNDKDNFLFLISWQLVASGFNQYQLPANEGTLVDKGAAARVDMIFIVSPAIPILAKFEQKIGRQ